MLGTPAATTTTTAHPAVHAGGDHQERDINRSDQQPRQGDAHPHEEAELPQGADHRGQIREKGQGRRARCRDRRLDRASVCPREALGQPGPVVRGFAPEVGVHEDHVRSEADDQEKRQEVGKADRRRPEHDGAQDEGQRHSGHRDEKAESGQEHVPRVEEEVDQHIDRRDNGQAVVGRKGLDHLDRLHVRAVVVNAAEVLDTVFELGQEGIPEELIPHGAEVRRDPPLLGQRGVRRTAREAEAKGAPDVVRSGHFAGRGDVLVGGEKKHAELLPFHECQCRGQRHGVRASSIDLQRGWDHATLLVCH
mmetsp:Transcript_31388/g.91638  ORF Transcript_31388/g.91638 Transcript_31388/m.91638 type:complete len:307 (+) Transcript_31388:2116-3036(+)